MKIKTYYLVLALGILLVIALIGSIVSNMLSLQRQVVENEGHRFRSYLLAAQLLQSSEELTLMARNYAVTGNPVYKDYYRQIMEIRDGDRARPRLFTPSYWYLDEIGSTASVPLGEAISLRESLIREKVTSEELALFEESELSAKELARIEEEAFAAREGRFRDASGQIALKSQPDLALAIKLLYSDEYARQKTKVLSPIDKLMNTLESRTGSDLARFESLLRQDIVWTLVILLLAGIGVLVGTMYSIRAVLKPIQNLHSRVDEVSKGDYTARADIKSKNEIGELGAHFNSMAESLELAMRRRKEAIDSMRSSEEHTKLLLNSTAEGIYGIDILGNCVFANAACATILGYASPEAFIGKNMHNLIHHSHPDGQAYKVKDCEIYKAFTEGKNAHVDYEVLWRADGTSFKAEYWSYPQRSGDKTYGAVVTFIDISDRKKREEALAEERRRLANILEGTNLGTWELNLSKGYMKINARFGEMLGYSLSELAPLAIDRFTSFVHVDDFQNAKENADKCFSKETKFLECEMRLRHKNEHWIWVRVRGQVVDWDSDGKALLFSGTQTDITAQKIEEERIRFLATHDALTGLPSRRLAEDRFAMAINLMRRNKRPLAILFIDLDGFKAVNDNLGHDAGDCVLKEIANRFGMIVRDTDTIARIGGDEFLIILNDLHSKDTAAIIAEKLIDLLCKPVILQNQEVRVGASIGIAISPENGDDMDKLLKLADAAMYSVKRSGKNGYAFAENDEALKG